MSQLTAQDIVTGYGKQEIVHGVSLTAEAGHEDQHRVSGKSEVVVVDLDPVHGGSGHGDASY